jgi:hypothetical protein
VDGQSRCFEVRIYTVDQSRIGTGTFQGGINELPAVPVRRKWRFKKHGADPRCLAADEQPRHARLDARSIAIARTATTSGRSSTPIPSGRRLSESAPVPVNANTFMMSATEYSPMK